MMKKIITQIQLANFSYEHCMNHGNVRDNVHQYLATVNENFISLRSYQCEESLKINQNPLGWKFHISIDDEENNIILAWNVIAPILIENGINFTKFLRPKGNTDESRQTYERGRQFTIYIEQNVDKNSQDWQDLINKITDKLVENNVKPGYVNLVAKVVPGSSYFYYRNDKPKALQAGDVDAVVAPSNKHTESQHTQESITDLDLPPPNSRNRAGKDELTAQVEVSPLLAKKSDQAGKLAPSSTTSSKPTEQSNQRAEKPSIPADSPKKSLVVPMLNLKSSLPIPTWAKTKPATAKETYLDNSIEKKYNPSNSEEGLLLPLRVDSKQPPPKEHPHEQLQKN